MSALPGWPNPLKIWEPLRGKEGQKENRGHKTALRIATDTVLQKGGQKVYLHDKVRGASLGPSAVKHTAWLTQQVDPHMLACVGGDGGKQLGADLQEGMKGGILLYGNEHSVKPINVMFIDRIREFQVLILSC